MFKILWFSRTSQQKIVTVVLLLLNDITENNTRRTFFRFFFVDRKFVFIARRDPRARRITERLMTVLATTAITLLCSKPVAGRTYNSSVATNIIYINLIHYYFILYACERSRHIKRLTKYIIILFIILFFFYSMYYTTVRTHEFIYIYIYEFNIQYTRTWSADYIRLYCCGRKRLCIFKCCPP